MKAIDKAKSFLKKYRHACVLSYFLIYMPWFVYLEKRTDEYIHVACPCCKNKRLFDLLRGSKGIVSIKCPICKAVVAVSLHDGRASSKKKL